MIKPSILFNSKQHAANEGTTMIYEGFTTFGASANQGILTVTFDYAPVNI